MPIVVRPRPWLVVTVRSATGKFTRSSGTTNCTADVIDLLGQSESLIPSRADGPDPRRRLDRLGHHVQDARGRCASGAAPSVGGNGLAECQGRPAGRTQRDSTGPGVI